MKTLHVATLPAVRAAFRVIEDSFSKGPDGSRHFAELVRLMTDDERQHRTGTGPFLITKADAVKLLIVHKVSLWHVRPQDMPRLEWAHRTKVSMLHLAGMWLESGSLVVAALTAAGYDINAIGRLALLDYAEAVGNPDYFRGQA